MIIPYITPIPLPRFKNVHVIFSIPKIFQVEQQMKQQTSETQCGTTGQLETLPFFGCFFLLWCFFFFYMGVSSLKWWYPPFHTPKNGHFLVGKQTNSCWGVSHHFRKPPNMGDAHHFFHRKFWETLREELRFLGHQKISRFSRNFVQLLRGSVFDLGVPQGAGSRGFHLGSWMVLGGSKVVFQWIFPKKVGFSPQIIH